MLDLDDQFSRSPDCRELCVSRIASMGIILKSSISLRVHLFLYTPRSDFQELAKGETIVL